MSPQPITRQSLAKKAGAETIGTFMLVFAGCGAIATNELTGGALGHLGVSITFGLVIAVMIYACGHLSGAHFNPAVTLAFSATGRFPWREAPAYWAGQVLGAVAGAGALRLILGPDAPLGTTAPAEGLGQTFALEVLITLMLMFVIQSVATDSRAEGPMAGSAIGSTVALCALFAGPISGASMNPARSLGPALLSGELTHLWIYWTAPLLGAILGAFAYDAIRCGDSETDAAGCC